MVDCRSPQSCQAEDRRHRRRRSDLPGQQLIRRVDVPEFSRRQHLGDQSRSQGIEQPTRRDASGTARPGGCDQRLRRRRPQRQRERLLTTVGINANDCLGARFVVQAAEQDTRYLTAERGISWQYHDCVSRLRKGPADSGYQPGSGPTARWIL